MYMQIMSRFKHLWVAKELLHLCAKFWNNFVLPTPKLEYLKSAMRSRSFENVRNKYGCVVLSTEKVDLSFGFSAIIYPLSYQ